MKKKESFRQFFKDEKDQKIFGQVFDELTLKTVHELATKGWFDMVEFPVSTGKEAFVFKAQDKGGNAVAVKVYKIETSDFKSMQQYLKGDYRFKKVKKDKRSIVYAWTRKEFKNLERGVKAGARVPLPIAFKNNVLVMSFVGEGDQAAPLIKNAKLKGKALEKAYKQVIEGMARLYRAGLVHSDLSEFNMLYWQKNVHIIDIGQAVLLDHPMARHFFERDCQNIARYFSKRGLKTDQSRVYAAVKAKTA